MKMRTPSGEPGIPGSASACSGDRNINIFIRRIEKIVAESISSESLDVGFLADHMCMSQSTLFRRMNEAFGMGANEYIRVRRLEMAADCLKKVADGDNATISDISFACGFSSQAAFAKAFRKHFGISASEYIESFKL